MTTDAGGSLGNIRAFELSDAEGLLLEHTEQEYAQATQTATTLRNRRISAILKAHGLPPDTQGSFQPDPLAPGVIRFLYRDEPMVAPTMLSLPAGSDV